MLIAQLTDTHVLDPSSEEKRHVDNNGRLREAVAALNDEKPAPEAVLATGDLTNWGHQGEYEALVEILADLRHPLLPLPGNHDDRDRIRAAFPDVPWSDTEHASWHVSFDGLDIIGLDSIIPGEPGGQIDQARAQWLRAAIDAAEQPILLALHHPPFTTGITGMDGAGFDGLDLLRDTIRHTAVARIVCGHMHRPMTSTVAGVAAQVGLSTVHHIGLDLNPGADLMLINDPAGYMLHRIVGDDWVTHTRYIATGESAFPL